MEIDFARKTRLEFSNAPKIFVHNRAVQPLMFDVKTRDYYETNRPIWCEYIESDGNQFIDSGVYGDLNTSVSITIKRNGTEDRGFFGSRINSNSNNGYNFTMQYYNNKIYVQILNSDHTNRLLYEGEHVNDKLRITAYKTKKEIYFGNELLKSVSTNITTNFKTPSTLKILKADDVSEDIIQQPIKANLYSCQIYEEGVMIRNFRPCLNPHTLEPCLYDMVEQKYYYNQGTGTFSHGPIITELEYIESSGTQYIDTGIKPTGDTSFWLKVLFFNCYSFRFFGAELDSIYAGFSGTSWSLFVISYNKILNPQQFNNKLMDIKYISSTVNINGTIYSCDSPAASTYNIYINARGDSLTQRIATAQWHDVKLYESHILSFDGMPCMTSNGTICMWDWISGEAKTNQGSGEFIAGPEVLPYGYTRVDYIEKQGDAYIETGVVPTRYTGVKLKSSVIVLPPIQQVLIGAGDQQYFSNGACFAYDIATDSNHIYLGYSNNYGSISYTATDNEIIIGYLNYLNNGKCGIGTTLVNLPSFTGMTSRTLNIFKYNDPDGNNWKVNSGARMYYVVLTEGSEIVRNYIPCINSQGEVGMFDTCTHKFLTNQGTGEFIPALPDGFSRLEYIQSTGTQWIDTGIKANINTKAELVYKYTALSDEKGSGQLFGTRSGRNSNAFIVTTSHYTIKSTENIAGQFDTVSSTIIVQKSVDLQKHTFSLSRNGFYQDDVLLRTYQNPTSFESPNTIILFDIADSATTIPDIVSKGRFEAYSFKLWDNGKLIRNLIPCTDPQGEVGMFDVCTYQFFANKGTGSFTAGPVID